MSRRPPVGSDKAAQNQATLKQLVKLEGNKSCADCKKNKHPRWASWNLGIFVCIRCSGIHRGMGTHISRVKSVDLDAWTDEQLQSMIRWGNTRANKYWEAKLAPGHVPAEAKIENYIRTKYDSKRWVMDGPMPDPSALDAGDDDAPLTVVQEKAKLDRASSLRNGSSANARRANDSIDLFGDEPSQPERPSTTEPVSAARPPPVKAPAVPAKQTKPGDSLLRLDFFGDTGNASTHSAPSTRPTSATTGLPQRTDLKQSILSLYASAPRPSTAQSSAQSLGSPTLPQQQAATGSPTLDDAFSTLNFGTAPSSTAKPAPFQSLTSPPITQSAAPSMPSGGGFFDTTPKVSKPPEQRQPSSFGDFGDFASATSPPVTSTVNAAPAASSTMGDLFDLSGPSISSQPPRQTSAPPKPVVSNPPPINMSSYTNSAFNLTTPAPSTQPKPAPAANFAAMSGMDAWGSDNAWNTPDPAPQRPVPPQTATSTISAKAAPTTSLSNDFGGWGSNDNVAPAKPIVTQDDDFGGWSSADPVSTAPVVKSTATTAPAPANAPAKSFGGGDDLFGNVWE